MITETVTKLLERFTAGSEHSRRSPAARHALIDRRAQCVRDEVALLTDTEAELAPLRRDVEVASTRLTEVQTVLDLATRRGAARRRAVVHDRTALDRALRASLPQALEVFLRDELAGRHAALMEKPLPPAEEQIEFSPHRGFQHTVRTPIPRSNHRRDALAVLAEVRAEAEALVYTALPDAALERTLAEFRDRLDAAGIPRPVQVWRSVAVAVLR